MIRYFSDLQNLIDKNISRKNVELLLYTLNERERKIIRHRFNLNNRQEFKTLSELGQELDLTRERIRQIEYRAIKKLRNKFIELVY